MSKDNPLKNQATATSGAKSTSYENNPFFVATNGLELLFKKAQSVGIAFAVLMGLSFLASVPSYFINPNESDLASPSTTATSTATPQVNIPVEFWAILATLLVVVIVVAFFIGLIVRGVGDYTSAQLANDKTVTLGEALRGLFANFWGYAWVIVVMQVKLFLWFLLLVIPGVVMSTRYALTGVMYFDKKLKGSAASKQSAELTKGLWLTTYASHSLLNMITFGAIQGLLVPGTNAVLYRQYQAVGENKPKAHVLSWLTLIIPFVLFILLVLLVLSIIALLANSQV